jgi:hypothetical protein
MNDWPKRCAKCGELLSASEWTSLPFVGFQDDGSGGRLELRNHGCGSTLAVSVTRAGLTDALRQDLAAVFRNEADEVGGAAPALHPGPRRTVSDEAVSEAARFHAIADALLDIEGESENEKQSAKEKKPPFT